MKRRCIFAVMMTFFTTLAMAAQTGDSKTIGIKGHLVEATGSCTFNNAESDVDFGEVKFENTADGNKISGTYQQELTSDMTCTGDSRGSATMTLTGKGGNSSNYNGHKVLNVYIMVGSRLSEEMSDLGIEFLVNGVVKDIDTPVAVDMQNPPVLSAEIVQLNAGYLQYSNNAFSTDAILTMAFD
ncbi:hypothetical protein VRB37_13040 [Erwinia billingiae]|uniref:hypothetical protein n=1 Tax=Erwinia billingiae TaxID=182337 RepID=UPI0012455ECA|nr:hypothetical protein [Erwinia billingiae]QEW32606.1 hypothetical protein D0N50_13385 [Erwinia billingiae]